MTNDRGITQQSTHVNLEYPWLSQSDIKDFFTCKLRFKLSKLDRRAFTHTFEYVMRGNQYHLVFNGFFEEVDLDKVVELCANVLVIENPDNTALCQYFREVCWGMAGKGYILAYKEKPYLYDMNIEGFCRFQARCVVEIIRFKGRISRAMLNKYWMPQGRELFLKDTDLQVYGTIDQWLYDFDDTPYVLDFKTGRAKSNMRIDCKTGELKKVSLIFPQNLQLWMYTYLLSKKLGCAWEKMKGIVVFTKGEDPGAIDLTIRKASITAFSKRLDTLREHVSTGKQFTPVFIETPENIMYTCTYCMYQGLCHSPEQLVKFQEMRDADGN